MNIWIVILIISAIVELATASLVSIWFIIGGAVGFLIDILGYSFSFQLVGFIVTALITFLLIRPKLLSYVKTPKVATNSDKLIGMTGEVLEKIGKLDSGKVKVQGQVWTAASEEEIIEAGELIVVKDIEGAKLIVRRRGN